MKVERKQISLTRLGGVTRHEGPTIRLTKANALSGCCLVSIMSIESSQRVQPNTASHGETAATHQERAAACPAIPKNLTLRSTSLSVMPMKALNQEPIKHREDKQHDALRREITLNSLK